MGVDLFERTQQGMVATHAGEIMVAHARRVLLELDRAVAEIRPAPGEVSGIVSVGAGESDRPHSPTHRDRDPNRLSVHRTPRDDRLLGLSSGMARRRRHRSFPPLQPGRHPVADGPTAAGRRSVGRRTPDAGLDPEVAVPWATILEQPLVLPVSGHGLRVLIDGARAGIRVQPRVSLETNSTHLQKQMVLAGFGWTVLPAAGVATEVSKGLLSAAPVTEPDSSRSIVLAVPRAARLSAPVDVVASELARSVRRLVRQGDWPSACLARQ